ncbi:MAG: crossover junction endodeoxyribonuclease RuvC [Patescibacteria group bacterium]
MRIIAIDPGFERVGIAVMEKLSGKESLLYSDCFKTPASSTFPDRLLMIGKEVEKLIRKWNPGALAIETLFFNSNQKTALRVSEARGVVVYAAAKNTLKIFEFTPLQVKIAVTGYGRAEKKQVSQMVKKLIKVGENVTSDDEIDAIAIGLACLAGVR